MSVPARHALWHDELVRAGRGVGPVAVAGRLGLRVPTVAAGMHANDVATPLTITTANRPIGGTDPMPLWCAGLLAQNAARTARLDAGSQARRVKADQGHRSRTERAYRLVESGRRRRFSDADIRIVVDVAFRAAKAFAAAGSADELCAGELSVLRGVGVQARLHRARLRPTSRCDGTGACCHQQQPTPLGSRRLVPDALP